MHFSVPPLDQYFIWRSFEANEPIKLRNNIINPFFSDPCPGVGVKFVITRQSCSFRACRVISYITPNSKRTDSEFDVRFNLLDSDMQFVDQYICIISSPVRDVLEILLSVLYVCFFIRKFVIFDRVGVKVVIKMNAIDVIVCDYF